MPTDRPRASALRLVIALAGVAGSIALSLAFGNMPDADVVVAAEQPTGDAQATVETDPVLESGDAADDPAIWYDGSNPARSVVVGNNKMGSLEVYDLTGRRIQRIGGGFFGNVDIRRGFASGAGPLDLVVTWQGGIRVYAINPATRTLANVTDTTSGTISVPTGGEGLCLYHSPIDGSTYAYVIARSGYVAQYQLSDGDGDGRIEGTLRRGWAMGSESESCVADDQLGFVYISEESTGIWKYSAEPTSSSSTSARTLVDTTVARGGHIRPDAEGLTIVYQHGNSGYLLASSQAASDELNSYMVYERQGTNAFVREFKVVTGAATDGCGRTDGIDALAVDLGPSFPNGLFVCQDNANTQPSAGNQNFKFVPLERIVALDGVGTPPDPTTTTTTTIDVPGETTTTSTTEVPGETTTTSTTTTEEPGETSTTTTVEGTEESTTTSSSTTTTTVSPTTTTVPPTTTTVPPTTTTVPPTTTTVPPTTTTVPPTTTTVPPTNAISYIGRATSNANATSHSVTLPSSTRAGDSLLLLIGTNTTATVSTPTGVTGWTQVSSLASSSSRSVVWRKVAVAADAGKVVRVSLSATTKANLVVVVHRGTSRANPVAAFARTSATSGVAHATPTVTVSRAGSWVVSYWTHKDSSTTTLVAPSGVVVRSNGTQTGSGRVTGLLADSGTGVNTGAAGNLSASGAAPASSAHMWTIVLAPA